MAVTDMKTQKLDQKLKQLHRYKEGERDTCRKGLLFYQLPSQRRCFLCSYYLKSLLGKKGGTNKAMGT